MNSDALQSCAEEVAANFDEQVAQARAQGLDLLVALANRVETADGSLELAVKCMRQVDSMIGATVLDGVATPEQRHIRHAITLIEGLTLEGFSLQIAEAKLRDAAADRAEYEAEARRDAELTEEEL